MLAAALLGMFSADVTHLVGLWLNSDTFGHCVLIPFVLGWLVWQRREELAKLTPRPAFTALPFVAGAALVWLVGDLAGVALLRHAGIVFLLQASVPLVFGWTVTRGLVFPLFFALFMIPAGEQLVPYLQIFTAHFSVWLLEAFGIPAYLDGVFISIPNGDFEVAEACSGVRFLIAMIAFSVLAAHVCFLSWPRRIAFVVAGIALSILANATRAWGTIYIAHLTTPAFARGVDHVVYGWVFFAIVMALLIAGGWRFFDRPVDDRFIDAGALQPAAVAGGNWRTAVVALMGAAALAGAAPFWSARVDAQEIERPTRQLAVAPPPGWNVVERRSFPWEPRYVGATAATMVTFSDGSTAVDVYIAAFDRQRERAELVGYGQGLIAPTTEEVGWAWAARLRGAPGGTGSQLNYGPIVRDVWQWYLVNDRIVATPTAAKVEGLKAKLTGRTPFAATLVLSAERRDPQVSAEPDLARLLAAMGEPANIIERARR